MAATSIAHSLLKAKPAGRGLGIRKGTFRLFLTPSKHKLFLLLVLKSLKAIPANMKARVLMSGLFSPLIVVLSVINRAWLDHQSIFNPSAGVEA